MDWNEFTKLFDNAEINGNKLVIKDNLVKSLSFIKDNYHFNMLKSITAVDNKENGIELIYNIFDVEDEEELLVSYFVKDEAESISKIFDSAVADEKEIYDLFGVKFIGNEELKRLYMPESWEGHPLKKDYQENDKRLNWND